jgi:hypothetical protein
VVISAIGQVKVCLKGCMFHDVCRSSVIILIEHKEAMFINADTFSEVEV